MGFRITDIKNDCFPTREQVTAAFELFGVDAENIINGLLLFQCSTPTLPGKRKGYQQNIASSLEHWFETTFIAAGCHIAPDKRYSAGASGVGDVVLENQAHQRAYVEIEFRPNFEKDLVKFQIGCNCGALSLAILVVVVDRDAINPSYTTMPEYAKVVQTIAAFEPYFPLLVIGIDGQMN